MILKSLRDLGVWFRMESRPHIAQDVIDLAIDLAHVQLSKLSLFIVFEVDI